MGKFMVSTVISHSKDDLSQTETQSRCATVVKSQKTRLAKLTMERSLPVGYIFLWLHYLIYQPHKLLKIGSKKEHSSSITY